MREDPFIAGAPVVLAVGLFATQVGLLDAPPQLHGTGTFCTMSQRVAVGTIPVLMTARLVQDLLNLSLCACSAWLPLRLYWQTLPFRSTTRVYSMYGRNYCGSCAVLVFKLEYTHKNVPCRTLPVNVQVANTPTYSHILEVTCNCPTHCQISCNQSHLPSTK